jgi:hypothetical protein
MATYLTTRQALNACFCALQVGIYSNKITVGLKPDLQKSDSFRGFLGILNALTD